MEAVVELSEGEGNEMTLEQALAEIENLKKQLAAKSASEVELADMKKKLGDFEAAAKKSEEEKKLSDKKADFDKRLTEGKVCEAQREAFMDGDMVKFADNAQSIKLNEQGNGGTGDEGKVIVNADSKTPAQDEVMALTEKMVKEEKISFSEAVKKVLGGNKALADKYNKEVSFG